MTKVYCGKCKNYGRYFYDDVYFEYVCAADENVKDTYRGREREKAEIINKKNNCKWYNEK